MTPDWCKREDYAYTDALDDCGWAWQYLRCHPDYEADFLDCVRRRQRLQARYGHDRAGWLRQDDDPTGWIELDAEDPPAPVPPHGFEAVDDRVPGTLRQRFEDYYRLKWGLKTPLGPPDGPTPEFLPVSPFPFEPAWDHLEGLYWGEGETADGFVDAYRDDPTATPTALPPARLQPGYSLLLFAHDRPIEPQLEATAVLLRQRRAQWQKTGNPTVPRQQRVWSRPLLLRNLRALHGSLAGAPNLTIAAVLFPDKKNQAGQLDASQAAYDAVKAGLKLMRGGYRFLASASLDCASSSSDPNSRPTV